MGIVGNADSSSSSITTAECIQVPLKTGGMLPLKWIRNYSAGAYQFEDNFQPAAGLGTLWSFYPVFNTSVGAETREDGQVPYGAGDGPCLAPITRYLKRGTTYYTVYEERLGTYFEYWAGSEPVGTMHGRPNRQYDTHGCELNYPSTYVGVFSGKMMVPTGIGGNALGRVVPYFEYSGNPVSANSNYHICKIYLLDLDDAANSRTIYYEYAGGASPVLSAIIYPDGCVQRFDQVQVGGGSVKINSDVDQEGYTTYFEYVNAFSSTPLTSKTVEPEGRITYFNYPSLPGGTQTKVTFLGRPTTYFTWTDSGGIHSSPLATQQTDPLGNTTLWGYDATVGRPNQRLEPNGNTTYFGYVAGTAENFYALAWQRRGFNNALTYFGYNNTYDLARVVGPRTTSSFSVLSYYEYNSTRERTAAVDALGNRTGYKIDSVGRVAAEQDARGNVTYFNFGTATGHTDSKVMADGSIPYFGYNSFRDQLRDVSPRWPEQGMAAFTTYYAYDQLSRKTKSIDPLGNLTYFAWTSRSDPLAVVDAQGTDTEYTYNGLRLMTQRTVTDRDGGLLARDKHGYDIYKNRTRSQDGRGNTTYFEFDQVDRLTSQKDALGNTSYFGYDSVRNLTRSTDPRNNSTYYFYDLLSRQTSTRNALGQAAYYFYDLADNRTHSVDPRGSATYFFYDALDRLQTTRDALGNPTYFYFDAVGNLTAQRNARFNSTYFFYDVRDRQSAVRDALGNLTYFGYDAASNRVRALDARLNATYYFYDTMDRPSALRDAVGNPTYFFYDPIGNRSVIRNARGYMTYYAYDGLSRLVAAKDPLGAFVDLRYDLAGNLIDEARLVENQSGYGTQPYGNPFYGYAGGVICHRYFAYDALNRLSALQDELGATAYFEYDPAGNVSKTVDPRGNATTVAYDALNRRSGIRDPQGNSTYYFYDPAGNRTVLKNALLHSTYFGYDALNRMTYVQDTLGGTTYFEFDAVSNLTKVLDADLHATQTRYDTLDRPDSIRMADGGSAYFFYDAVSNRIKELDPLGNVTYYAYDALNRATRIQDALFRTLYFEYDPVGNLSNYVDSEASSSAHTYDAANRRTQTTYTAAGAAVSASLRSNPYYGYNTVSQDLTTIGDLWGLHLLGYDNRHRLLRHQYPNGSKVYFEYDAVSNVVARVYPGTAGKLGAAYDSDNRQFRVQAPSGATAYFAYDAASNLTQRFLGNSVKQDVTYDAAERIQQWRNTKLNSASLTYFDYSRDSKGLITKAVREATHSVYYTYDANDRLMSELWAKTGATPSEVYGYRYAYDVAGNRTKLQANGSNTYYFYDQANQLKVSGSTSAWATPTYYLYDKNGSLTNLVEPSGATYFAYNAAGLIARIGWRDASSTYFFYDGNLQRYAMVAAGVSTATYFLWDGPNLLQELNADGTVKEEHTNAMTPIAGIGQLVETNRPGQAQAKLYPVMDPRGTITKWMQSDGNTVFAAREYESFGNLIPNSSSGTWPGRQGYQGQTWMEIFSGNGSQRLLLSPTRTYDPVTGRFQQNEPLFSRRRFAHYVYSSQNPLRFIDPSGLAECPCQDQGWQEWMKRDKFQKELIDRVINENRFRIQGENGEAQQGELQTQMLTDPALMPDTTSQYFWGGFFSATTGTLGILQAISMYGAATEGLVSGAGYTVVATGGGTLIIAGAAGIGWAIGTWLFDQPLPFIPIDPKRDIPGPGCYVYKCRTEGELKEVPCGATLKRTVVEHKVWDEFHTWAKGQAPDGMFRAGADCHKVLLASSGSCHSSLRGIRFNPRTERSHEGTPYS